MYNKITRNKPVGTVCCRLHDASDAEHPESDDVVALQSRDRGQDDGSGWRNDDESRYDESWHDESRHDGKPRDVKVGKERRQSPSNGGKVSCCNEKSDFFIANARGEYKLRVFGCNTHNPFVEKG